ncbi:MAG: hypothetical protein ACYDBV_14285 [Nitrospiria bacterium]
MKPFLIVKNISREGPGLFETVLNSHRVRHRVVDLDKGETFSSPAEYSALVVLGGPESANDTTEKIKNDLSRIQEALTLQIPAWRKNSGGLIVVEIQQAAEPFFTQDRPGSPLL